MSSGWLCILPVKGNGTTAGTYNRLVCLPKTHRPGFGLALAQLPATVAAPVAAVPQ